MRTERSDRGDIVIGWLTKILVVLTIFGVCAFEAVSIGLAHVRTQDPAGEAARVGSQQYQRTKNVDRAYLAAVAVAADKSGTIAPEEFFVENDGTVEVTVRREASSILLYRFGMTRDWLDVAETARAKYVA